MRYWSNASQWPDQRMPLPGEDVYVDCNWTVIMDMSPAPAGMIEIDGDVIIEDKMDINITCEFLWVKGGTLTAGEPSQPFMHNLVFQFNGGKKDEYFTFDVALQANKILMVTGKLTLYGYSPGSTITKLTKTAFAKDTEIEV